MSSSEEVVLSEHKVEVVLTEHKVEVVRSEIVTNPTEEVSEKNDIIVFNTNAIIDTIVNTLLKEVKAELAKNGKIFGSSTLHLVIKYAMEAVEKRNLKGLGQKHIVINIINELIKELPDSDEKTLLISLSQSGAIGNTIELIVDATKGKLNVNQVAEVAIDIAKTSCFMPCLSYLFAICKKRKQESIQLEVIKT